MAAKRFALFREMLPSVFAPVFGGTSVFVAEDSEWRWRRRIGLKEISGERHVTLSELVAAIVSQRQYGDLSSAIRLFVLNFYRAQVSEPKEQENGGQEMTAHTAPAYS